MDCVKTQIYFPVIKTPGQAIAFLLKLLELKCMIEKLGWVFERLGHVFRNKYSVVPLGQRFKFKIFENVVIKEQPTCIDWKSKNLIRALLIYSQL